jgi:hypothetical protein
VVADAGEAGIGGYGGLQRPETPIRTRSRRRGHHVISEYHRREQGSRFEKGWLDSSIEIMARLLPSHDDVRSAVRTGRVIYLIRVQTPSQIARRFGQRSCFAFSVNSFPATDQM